MVTQFPSPGTPAWYLRRRSLPHGRWSVECFVSHDHADGEILDGNLSLDGTYRHWSADLDAKNRPVIAVNPLSTGPSPPLWFVAVPETDRVPQCVSLVAFVGDLRPPGTIVSDAEFFSMDVRSEDQVAALRWSIDDGTVDQIFVNSAWRRKGVGSTTIYTADGFHQFNGWPGRLKSDGRRTEMGETFIATLRFPQRMAPLQDLAPPMDPPG